jgi:hypothetical protein
MPDCERSGERRPRDKSEIFSENSYRQFGGDFGRALPIRSRCLSAAEHPPGLGSKQNSNHGLEKPMDFPKSIRRIGPRCCGDFGKWALG